MRATPEPGERRAAPYSPLPTARNFAIAPLREPHSPQICVFAALSVFLSGIEYLLPKPLPFLRLGLANMPVMLALFFDVKSFVLLVIIKITAGAIFTGTLFSYTFLFSAAGSTVSAFVMYLLHNLFWGKNGGNSVSFAGLGVIGALFSNIAQVALARFFVLGRGAIYIAPALIGFGVISGFALGLFCNLFAARSRWYKTIRENFRAATQARLPSAFAPAAFNKKAFIYFLIGAGLSFFVIISR
jgi:heptaprenyl diphosphate synthase